MPSEPNSMDVALAGFIRDRDDLVRQVNVLNRIIDNLEAEKANMRQGPPEPPTVSEGQYVGMRTGEALASYLRRRAGFKIPINKVFEDLKLGGASLAATPGRERQNLKITVRRSPKLVEKDEHWNIWLAETATRKPPPRNKKKS
jgi:hypothetical protein